MTPIRSLEKRGIGSRWLSGGWLDSLPFMLLVGLVVVYVAMEPAVLDPSQIGLQLQSEMPLLLMACGECFVILLGGVDLSVGGICSLASALIATHSAGFPGGPWLAALCIIGVGAMAGVLNGLLVTYGGLVPFIATLATWSIWGGVALVILPTDGGTVPIEITDAAVGSFAGLPNSIWFVVALAVAWFLFRRTPFAASLYAVGGDEARARLRGIDSNPVKIAAFAAAGGFAAAAGLFLSAETTTGLPQAGDALILTSIAAIVIGGTSLSGGAGGIGLTIAGTLILLTLGGVVAALGLTPTFAYVVSSLLLICMVAVRHIATRLGAE
jgi:ribose transport system permease protein